MTANQTGTPAERAEFYEQRAHGGGYPGNAAHWALQAARMWEWARQTANTAEDRREFRNRENAMRQRRKHLIALEKSQKAATE